MYLQVFKALSGRAWGQVSTWMFQHWFLREESKRKAGQVSGSEHGGLRESLGQAGAGWGWLSGPGFLLCKMSQTHPTSWDRSK